MILFSVASRMTDLQEPCDRRVNYGRCHFMVIRTLFEPFYQLNLHTLKKPRYILFRQGRD